MKSLNCKTVVSAFAVVALLATPAFAQKTHKHSQAAAASAATTQGLYDRAGSNVVIGSDGRVIGADPDPVIRSYLLRDEGSATGAF
jgi:hypothetical protein